MTKPDVILCDVTALTTSPFIALITAVVVAITTLSSEDAEAVAAAEVTSWTREVATILKKKNILGRF